MNQSENEETGKNLLKDSSPFDYGFGYEYEPAEPPIVRLCRQYVTLAIGAAIIFLLHISLNTWVFSGYMTAALSLLILALAIYYGSRISRQARIDAQRNEKSLGDARQLLEELHRSEERFRIASECASDLVYERDLITNTSRFFYPQAGGPQLSDTMEGFRISIHPEDRAHVWASLQNHLETGAQFSEEYRISDNKGGYMTISDRAVAILNQEGKPIRLVGSASDITERKRVEQLRSDFVSFVTHQLRTPLSGVKWMLELAMDEKDNPEEMQSFITDARLSTERLIRLVNDLLDISRLKRGKQKFAPRPVDLEKLTGDAVAEMNPSLLEMKQTLTMEIANSLPHPDADRQMLRQAIMNLLSNSIKYTPAEGSIDIRISAEHGSVRWEISDTGIGIPKEDQEKLFEIFYRASNVLAIETEGTGLGLYLARLTIEQFGGRLWCESEEGVGSKFIFTLPAANQDSPL